MNTQDEDNTKSATATVAGPMMTLTDLAKIINAGFDAKAGGEDPMRASLKEMDALLELEAKKITP